MNCAVFEEEPCTQCNGCGEDTTESEIALLTEQGHTTHCAARQLWGDGECECELKGAIPGTLSKIIANL